MRSMVTGAGGMVGSHLVERLAARGDEVLGTYYKPTVDLGEIHGCGARLEECDVRYAQHVERLVRGFKPDVVYHLAAQSYPAVSWSRPQETLDTNAGGTVSVFEAVKAARADDPSYDPAVVVACSSAEYGATLDELRGGLVTENAPLKPLHPYGVSKVAQDLLAFQYSRSDGIRSVRVRIFNTTGPRKVGDAPSDFVRRAVAQERAGAEYPVLRVGNLETRRALLDVRDLVSAFVLLADGALSGSVERGDVFNVASENVYAMREVVECIERTMGVSFELRQDSSLLRPTDEKVIAGDTSRLCSATGWRQSIAFEQTIADMVAYWRGKA